LANPNLRFAFCRLPAEQACGGRGWPSACWQPKGDKRDSWAHRTNSCSVSSVVVISLAVERAYPRSFADESIPPRPSPSPLPSRRWPPLHSLQHLPLLPPARGPASLKSSLRQRKGCLFIKTHRKGTALHRSHTSLPLYLFPVLVKKRAGGKGRVYLSRQSFYLLRMCEGQAGQRAQTKTALSSRHSLSLLPASSFPEVSEAVCGRKGGVYLSRHSLWLLKRREGEAAMCI
jgi:hypothetical protein